MKTSIIVALAENGVIGSAGELPWRLSADLARFKRLTMGHTIVMGRKTYESIGRPLPGRTSIVITRQPAFRPDGVLVAPSLESALGLAGDDDETFIIGGAEIYRIALPRADRLYLTRVHAVVEGDVFFPPLDMTEWVLVDELAKSADERNVHPITFQVYDRAVVAG